MSSKSKKNHRGAFGNSNPQGGGKIRCYNCDRPGRAVEKKFPVQVFKKQRTFARQDGKLKVADKPKLVGHLCLKCTKKQIRREQIQNAAKSKEATLAIKGYK